MGSIPKHVEQALIHGAWAPELLRDGDPSAQGYSEVETGYTLTADGGMVIACLTDMPGLDPEAWQWWFAWHGDDSSKYKLWHPRAHVEVGWQDAGTSQKGYVGRTSLVTEYVGASVHKLAIRFVEPQEFGITPRDGDVAICAKVRLQGTPVDAGKLVHYVRRTQNGCEMRSRFWIGGGYIESFLGRGMARWFIPRSESDARELLVHCAEEMNHLAKFLSELREEFGRERE